MTLSDDTFNPISVLKGASGSITNNEMYSPSAEFEITVETGVSFTPSINALRKGAGSDSNGNKALSSRP